jgi:hypothetical protein
VTRSRGRHAAARALYVRALAAFEQAYGPGHRLTRVCRANLARLSRDMDRSRRTRAPPSPPARRRA